jgi:uncharacterized membrane protein
MRTTTTTTSMTPRRTKATSNNKYCIAKEQQQKRGRRSATVIVKSSNGDDTLKNLESLLPDDENERLQKEREREAEEKYKEQQEQKRLAEDLASAIKNQKQNKKNTFTMGDDGDYDFSQKSIAALCYMLPLLDSLKYSKFLLIQFPLASLALLPLKPLIELWFALGFLQIAVFFGMYLGIIQNQNMSRFVRFNAQQAILLDILLILPDVLTRLFAGMDGQGPTGGIGLQAEVIMFNSVFLFTYISCLVGSVSATSGKTVKLPLIGEASDSQTR